MKYWYDCEFEEYGKTIIPISIGIVSEDDRELYLINKGYMDSYFDIEPYYWKDEPSVISCWLDDNVLDKITDEDVETYGVVYEDWSSKILDFISDGGKYIDRKSIELWGHFGAYDHVLLCQTFGSMVQLPEPIPMWTHDDMQIRNGQRWQDRDLVKFPQHSAISDAKFQKYQWECWTNSASIG